MIKFGMFGAVCTFISLSLVEISTYLCQFGGADMLSVYIIMMQLGYFSYSVSMGAARAAAMLVGQSLSEGDGEKTTTYIKLALVNATAVYFAIAMLGYFFRNYEVSLFSTDEGVTSLFMSSAWLFCVWIFLSQFESLLYYGFMVAFGAQKLGTITKCVATFAIGLPLVGITIFFSDLSVTGVLIGLIIGSLTFIAASSIWMGRVDIEKEMEECTRRISDINRSSPPADESSPILEDEEAHGHSKTVRVVCLVFASTFVGFILLVAVSFMGD